MNGAANAESLSGLRVATPAKTENGDQPDLRDESPTMFVRYDSNPRTTNPVVRTAFMEMRSRFPYSIPFSELASIAKSKVSGEAVAVDAGKLSTASRALAETLLRYYETSMVDLHFAVPTFTTMFGDQPECSPLARHQARPSSRITNQMHQSVSLDDLERMTVTLLDGKSNLEQIEDRLTEKIVSGELVLYQVKWAPIFGPRRGLFYIEKRGPSGAADR